MNLSYTKPGFSRERLELQLRKDPARGCPAIELSANPGKGEKRIAFWEAEEGHKGGAIEFLVYREEVALPENPRGRIGCNVAGVGEEANGDSPHASSRTD